MIVCVCRGKSEKQVMRAIEAGASTLRDLQRCGIGDQCGSCHSSLVMLLARAAATEAAHHGEPCPACALAEGVAVATA